VFVQLWQLEMVRERNWQPSRMLDQQQSAAARDASSVEGSSWSSSMEIDTGSSPFRRESG
jgi:hypothetical protein